MFVHLSIDGMAVGKDSSIHFSILNGCGPGFVKSILVLFQQTQIPDGVSIMILLHYCAGY